MYSVDPYEFTKDDARRTFRDLAALWRHHVFGLPDPPAAVDQWAHATADRIAIASGEVIGPAAPGERLEAAGRAADRCLTEGLWNHAQVTEELGAAWLGLRRLADAIRSAGAFGAPATGTVVQLNRSAGGVPKRAVAAADVDWSGVVGDVQATRRHHGRPWQALCLWDADVIAGFAAAGHPLDYGSAGENVTIAGLEWARVRPGVRIRIGAVRCEASAYALPCSQNARWFVGGRFDLMHHERGPVSRIYATVLAPGSVATGDEVLLEP